MYNVNTDLEFTWDGNKNSLNKLKHRVSFEEASTIFMNLPLEIFYDEEHSGEDERYIAIGLSSKNRILLVVHCENNEGNRIRIISARKATVKEQSQIFVA